MCAMGSGPLAQDVQAAVLRALEDERGADAFYQSVIARFGASPPFDRIQRAEERHAAALERVLNAHGVAIPPEKPAGAQPTFDSTAAACKAGAAAEKANIALYDDLSKLALPDDVKCVFSHLREASLARHLPAFERCGGP